jgi:CubicO group peptidase (beta-lactamase class C family)
MGKVKKWILRIGAILLGLAILATIIFWKDIKEIREVLKYANLFEPDTMTENFRSMYKLYPSTIVEKSGDIYELEYDLNALNLSYTFKGEKKNITDWITDTDTTGLIVLHDGKIIVEEYYLGTDETTHVISMSVAKSILSFLLGVSIDEGKIASIEDNVETYAPELVGSGYEGVSIKDVLQMSSGIRFTEDYNDLQSDFVRMIAAFTTGSLIEFILSLPNEMSPGTHNRYVSANSQVLGMVLAGANGKSVTQLTEEKLWSQLGVESKAMWLTDNKGHELTAGGFNAIHRDYARFGLLYLNNGRNFQGKQLVSEEWVKASYTMDEPHLLPGDNPNSDSHLGYGYHWWLPENPQDDYLAIGIYGQFIYINTRTNTVIVKTSAYKEYDPSGWDLENECIDAFQAIANSFSRLSSETL